MTIQGSKSEGHIKAVVHRVEVLVQKLDLMEGSVEKVLISVEEQAKYFR